MLGNSREVMIFLDSFHTHEHVLTELRLYSPLIGKGQYLVCGDTIVENIPAQEHRQRPWGPGNNPKTAVDAFLQENGRFEVDKEIEDKLLLTCNPGGFLKCIRD
jgi:cephalosporin hydroxylase